MTRRKMDAYYTPSRMTEILLQHVYLHGSGAILEPCSGNGAISNVLVESYSSFSIVTNDYDPMMPADKHEDATMADSSIWQGNWDWVISNPPYNRANEIVKLALEHSRNVAMLLRLSFLEPCQNRADLLQADPLSKLIIFSQPRPSFTDDGRTDSVTTAWFVWTPRFSGETEISYETGWAQ